MVIYFNVHKIKWIKNQTDHPMFKSKNHLVQLIKLITCHNVQETEVHENQNDLKIHRIGAWKLNKKLCIHNLSKIITQKYYNVHEKLKEQSMKFTTISKSNSCCEK